MKKKIETSNAPAAIGPYSQAVEAGDFIYVSGQLPIDSETGEMKDGISAQTRQSLENIKAILESCNLKMDNVIKTTVFLKDMNCFAEMNAVYAEFFNEPFPARAAIQAARLPKDAEGEIQAIAYNK